MVIDAPHPDENALKERPDLDFRYRLAASLFAECCTYAAKKNGGPLHRTPEFLARMEKRFEHPKYQALGDQTARLEQLAKANLDAFSQGGWAVLERHNRHILERAKQLSHLDGAHDSALRGTLENAQHALLVIRFDETQREADALYARESGKAGSDERGREEARRHAAQKLGKAASDINAIILPPALVKARLEAMRGEPVAGNDPQKMNITKHERIELNRFQLSYHPPQGSAHYLLDYSFHQLALDFMHRSREATLVFPTPEGERTLAQMQQENPQAIEYRRRGHTAMLTPPMLREGERNATNSYFMAAAGPVLADHIKREERRAEFIEAVMASKEYAQLKNPQAQADYLSLRLLETYKVTGNHNGWLAISDYGTTASIEAALEKQRVKNREPETSKAAPLDPMQQSLRDFQQGANPARRDDAARTAPPSLPGREPGRER